MTMKKTAYILAAVCFSILACKKKENKTNNNNNNNTDSTYKYVSKYTGLTTDRWKINAVYILTTDGKDTILDYYSSMKNCEKDNYIQFNTNHSVSVDEGAEKCDASASQITTDGTWSLNMDTTVFTLADSKVLPISGTVIAKVENLSYYNLKISKDTTIVYPGIGTITGVIYANFNKVK